MLRSYCKQDALVVALDGELDHCCAQSVRCQLDEMLADPSVRSSSKIAFRRYAILGEPAARVAADLGLSVNALYQIKNRLTERLAVEVRSLEIEDGAAPR